MAAVRAVELALERRWTHVLFESDSKLLCDDLASELPPCWKVEAMISSLRQSFKAQSAWALHWDEEFSRETLAVLNPFSIQLVKEWPLKSMLDSKVYGAPESLITTELVEREVGGIVTVKESDGELQAWWTDVRTKGHADKMDEAWWPVLETTENLAYNTRTNMPTESPCKDEF
ncbi:Linoleate 13S-lipoxygenase 2-1, chloroplastic [Morella rubra]|uniref:Linoleate 13S-lipoxygenase 2-1, chloroplastic n=1 Tax=Morella rubra TaxID=262757 RepID=A0A6A1WIZ2_9ROSI|nr:Linoleate 13S-lipoxygenase 2-1, chloroplastic [Morella rubra]